MLFSFHVLSLELFYFSFHFVYFLAQRQHLPRLGVVVKFLQAKLNVFRLNPIIESLDFLNFGKKLFNLDCVLFFLGLIDQIIGFNVQKLLVRLGQIGGTFSNDNFFVAQWVGRCFTIVLVDVFRLPDVLPRILLPLKTYSQVFWAQIIFALRKMLRWLCVICKYVREPLVFQILFFICLITINIF